MQSLAIAESWQVQPHTLAQPPVRLADRQVQRDVLLHHVEAKVHEPRIRQLELAQREGRAEEGG